MCFRPKSYKNLRRRHRRNTDSDNICIFYHSVFCSCTRIPAILNFHLLYLSISSFFRNSIVSPLFQESYESARIFVSCLFFHFLLPFEKTHIIESFISLFYSDMHIMLIERIASDSKKINDQIHYLYEIAVLFVPHCNCARNLQPKTRKAIECFNIWPSVLLCSRIGYHR